MAISYIDGDFQDQIDHKLDKPAVIVNDKFIKYDENGHVVCGDAATAEQVAEAVTDWLEENVPQGTTVVVDKSLSIDDAAADAAKTGSEIGNLKSALEEDIFGTICVPYDPTFAVIEGGVNSNNGSSTTSSLRARTQYVDVSPNTLYIFRLINDDFVIVNGVLYTRAEVAGYTRRVTLENDRCLIFKTSDTETKLRVCFAHNDLTTTVSQSDRATIKDSIKIFTYTDTTLTKSGSPADAKATGDMGAEMGDYIDKLVDVVSKDNSVRVDWSELYRTNNHPLGWMAGYFNSSDGSPSTSTKWIRTIYRLVDFSAAIGFVIEPPTGYSVVVCEYDQNKDYIGSTTISKKDIFFTNGHRFTFYVGRFDDSSADAHLTQEFIDTIKVTAFYESSGSDFKKPRTGDYEFFSVHVDRPLAFGGEETPTTQEEIECVLRLPATYQQAGQATQLVLACHGAHGYIQKSTTTWYNSNWKTFMDALLAAGYAVFDANIFPTSTGTDVMGYALGSPYYVNVLKKAYDYIRDKYNVTEKIFVHGTSMGGVGATAFALAYPQIVLAESSFAGRDFLRYLNTLYQNQLDPVNNTVDERFPVAFGYENLTALTADHFSHAEGLFPGLSIIKYVDGIAQIPPDRETDYVNWLGYYSQIAYLGRNDNPGIWFGRRAVPYKAWNSWADNEQYTKLQTVLQKVYNRGNACPYYVVNYESGTHTQMSYGQINDMIPQLIEWYKRFDQYSYSDNTGDE